MTMTARILDDSGEGTPLVYICGIDGTGEYLLETADRLRPHFRLIRVCYREDHQAEPDSYRYLAKTLHQSLEAHSIQDPLLLAESFGGGVALQYCLDQPGKVRALALVNSFSWYRSRNRLRLSHLLFPLTSTRLFLALRRRWAIWALFGALAEPAATQAFRSRKTPIFDELYRRRLSLILGLDLRKRLPEIHCPVRLFASERDRVVDSCRQAQLMHSLLPHSSVRRIPRGGHLILPLASIPWAKELQDLAQERGEAPERAPIPP